MADKQKYKKMNRTYRKTLKKLVKDSGPWEWSYGLDMFIEFLKWMRDYYKLGYNVWATEDCNAFPDIDKDKPTRFESLDTAIKLYEKWQNCDDEFMKVIFLDEPNAQEQIDELVEQGYTVCVREKNDTLLKNTAFLYKFKDSKENNEAYTKAYLEYKKQFFEYVGEHIEEWWD